MNIHCKYKPSTNTVATEGLDQESPPGQLLMNDPYLAFRDTGNTYRYIYTVRLISSLLTSLTWLPHGADTCGQLRAPDCGPYWDGSQVVSTRYMGTGGCTRIIAKDLCYMVPYSKVCYVPKSIFTRDIMNADYLKSHLSNGSNRTKMVSLAEVSES